MTKGQQRYVCQGCGTWYPKWTGRCEACHEWNTLVEEFVPTVSKEVKKKSDQISFLSLCQTPENEGRRTLSNIYEFDRVCGGGLVPGSVILLGGDPGIGKSTLVLQILGKLSEKATCYYLSGEESFHQISLRASRLKEFQDSPKVWEKIKFLGTSDLSSVLHSFHGKIDSSCVLVVDSIQTMMINGIDAAAGSVSQIRAATHEIIKFAKESNVITFIIGHVTKEGALAGPKMLEHMVDTVLYFEGQRFDQHRVLRTVKNRFGTTDEIGLFQMTEQGLIPVNNPSEFFLDRFDRLVVPGTSVFASFEGSRPIFCEIQALVSQSYLTSPRRQSIGWDQSRLSMILAVLESCAGVSFSQKDVYLNITGGLQFEEPALDLSAAAALLSARLKVPIPYDTLFFGEIGLTGEIRAVTKTSQRIKEAKQLQFKRIFCPPLNKTQQDPLCHPIRHIKDLLSLLDLQKNNVIKKN